MFNLKLKELRIRNSKTQEEMANLLDISRVSYTLYESGKNMPEISRLKKIADIFDVSVDYLLDRSNEDENNTNSLYLIRLRQLRKFNNYTTDEVANLLGITRTAYVNYESGIRKPNIDKFIMLSKIYNTSVDYLLGLTNIDNNKTFVDNTLANNFSERLKIIRKNMGLKQQDVADMLQMDRSSYAGYEIGKSKPPLEKLIEIANYFNVPLDYLTGRNFNENMIDISKNEELVFKINNLNNRDKEFINKMIDYITKSLK